MTSARDGAGDEREGQQNSSGRVHVPSSVVPAAFFVNLSINMMLFQTGGRLYCPPSQLCEVFKAQI